MAPKNGVSRRQLEKNSSAGSGFDFIKWFLVAALLVAGIVANIQYSEVAGAIRAAVGIVLFAVILLIASWTSTGKLAWEFIKGARTEIRKVVWPTRQETIQTTIIVVLMVIATAIILWGLDAFFLWLVGFLTGQRGV